ncbi:hypothetical protein [Micromonospora sp. NPDC005172]|uniref:hypothetical protein n=1 Tax=Micromonospora sp. NPDC005172 TaxID=3156867 RepID=UPI0033B2CB76
MSALIAAYKAVTHDNPAVMRPIAEAAVHSGVNLVTQRGSVLLRKVEEAETARNADEMSLKALEISTASFNLSFACNRALFE